MGTSGRPCLCPTSVVITTTEKARPGLTPPGGLPVLGVMRRDGEADLLPYLEAAVGLCRQVGVGMYGVKGEQYERCATLIEMED